MISQFSDKMRISVASFFLVLALGCTPQTVDQYARPWLDDTGVEMLRQLMTCQGDTEQFMKAIERMSRTGSYQSVYAITYAMIELPVIGDIEDIEYGPDSMPKIIAEMFLDGLVLGGVDDDMPHDELSAQYWRALDRKEDGVEEAQRLLHWTHDAEKKMKWTGRRFESVEPSVDIGADIQAIKDLVADFNVALNTGDIDKASFYFADEVIVIPPNRSILMGKAAFINDLQQLFEQFTFKEVDVVKDVQIRGDLAVIHYTWTCETTPKAGGEPTNANGNGIMFLKKQPDNIWKFIYLFGSS